VVVAAEAAAVTRDYFQAQKKGPDRETCPALIISSLTESTPKYLKVKEIAYMSRSGR
jgi:hypothetical protein